MSTPTAKKKSRKKTYKKPHIKKKPKRQLFVQPEQFYKSQVKRLMNGELDAKTLTRDDRFDIEIYCALNNWNRSDLARLLKVSRVTVWQDFKEIYGDEGKRLQVESIFETAGRIKTFADGIIHKALADQKKLTGRDGKAIFDIAQGAFEIAQSLGVHPKAPIGIKPVPADGTDGVSDAAIANEIAELEKELGKKEIHADYEVVDGSGNSGERKAPARIEGGEAAKTESGTATPPK